MKKNIGLILFILAGFWLAACQNQPVLGSLPEAAISTPVTLPPLPESQPARETAVSSVPVTPPDAGKISVSAPDVDGTAAVSGAAGAVPGDVSLAIINLSTRNVITATASSSGAFNANLFAPPGSTLLVKYSPDPTLTQVLWQDAFNPGGDFAYMNPLPGTTLFVPGLPAGSGVPFHSAGYFGPGEGPDWAGWWISGEVSGPVTDTDLHVQPGDQITISGTLYVTSPALNCSNPPSFTPNASFRLSHMFGPDGQAWPGRTAFNSYLFTPTGLPIERDAAGEVLLGVGFANALNLTCLSQQTARGDLSTSITVPVGLPEGVYQLTALMSEGGLPLASGIPRVVVWHHFDSIATLPTITIGAPAPPRIPWTLFGDYPTNGHRGVQAVEDNGRYQMVTRTIIPPHRVVLPMLDARSGSPISYRLEPGSNWLSFTDRRFPNPPLIPLQLPGGSLQVLINKPDGSSDTLGPAPIQQSSVRTPSVPDGTVLQEGTGHLGDIFHLHTGDDAFAYAFDQYGPHIIGISGYVEDVYGNQYPLDFTYEVMVARVLDLDPAQLPTTPYQLGDAFAPGLHLFPPLPADVTVELVHMPFSDPALTVTTTVTGQANRFGYFQPPLGTAILLETPGEFRVDISAEYTASDGTMWAGYLTWGNVVEGDSPMIAAHGRRGMDYYSNTINDMPPWFTNANLPPEKIGIENYYPYFSGDIHWGDELAPSTYRGDSIHPIITLEDLTGPAETIYNLLRQQYPRATTRFREPPLDFTLTGLEKRLEIGEAPLFITTRSGREAAIYPDEIDMWGYWYGSSERPDVHVREIISEDYIGTGYWRFNDTYGYQIGEPADGDQPGDLKWEFGGIVLRTITDTNPINEYAIYSSLWVLLPHNDPIGARVTPPFRGAGVLDGGPIMSMLGQDIDMLFLPKGVRPGDVLEVGDTIAFSGHVGPPLDSRVAVTITAPSGAQRPAVWHANKIGWLYDPGFDFIADEPGRWTVDVAVLHDRPYVGTGGTPTSNNTGTVLGTSGQYVFYVVEPGTPRLFVYAPEPGFITWSNNQVEPVEIQGVAPAGTTAVHFTIHDKGVVMGQGSVVPDANGNFTITYDAKSLQNDFPMLSLTAHEGRWEGLADEVTINLLAEGGEIRANTVTLIGEEVFIGGAGQRVYLPAILKGVP